MTIEKNREGITLISDIVDNVYYSYRYMGFSDAECIREFKKYVKEEEEKRELFSNH